MKPSLPILLVLLAAFSAAAHSRNNPQLPDPALTPGVINPGVHQENIDQTICVSGFTKSIRPPAYFTNRLKKAQLREYGLAEARPKDYEEDHLIPLEIGGNPSDARNLWPQPWHTDWSARHKDKLENTLHRLVCDRQISLAEAQHAIASDWIKAYQRYVGPSSR